MFHRHSGHGHALLERARDVISDSRELVRTGTDEAGEFIEGKPVLATLIAAGAGLILGLFFGRRSKPADEGPKLRRSRPPPKSRRANRS